MTNYIEYAFLGFITALIFAIWVRLGNPRKVDWPARDYKPRTTEGLRPPHNPDVYGVRRGENGEAIIECEFTGAMRQASNHEGIGSYLNRGPDFGIKQHGGNIEWGTTKEEPKLEGEGK